MSGNGAYVAPYGLMSPAQMYAMRSTRLFHEHGVSPDTLKAVALAAYHHAQQNPRAVMHGRPLTEEGYDEARWIVEPFRLFDCCLENDGAAALIVMSAERAKDVTDRPAYLLGAQQGGYFRSGAAVHNPPDYATSSLKLSAPRLFAQAGVKPADVQVAQSYENFTGGVVMSPHRARVLHLRGGQRVPHLREPRRPRRAACPSTPRAATWPSATCTASAWWSRPPARSGATRPTRCRTAT